LICKLNSCHTPVTNSYIDRMLNELCVTLKLRLVNLY